MKSIQTLRTRRCFLQLAIILALAPVAHAQDLGEHREDIPNLHWQRAENLAGAPAQFGTLRVWENRATCTGRILDLDVVVLRACADQSQADPVFIFQGGPGLAAADGASYFARHWMRNTRDVVLLSQRGTGGTNRLDCDAPGSPDHPQGYLDPVFADLNSFRKCLDALADHADLSWYGTATAMDDLDDLRRLMGYDKINVSGGSYGSRAALEYVRRHGEHVRCAIVTGVAPVAFLNPLYHASAAQGALDLICAECAADPDCNAAYPDLADKVSIVLERLADSPADVKFAGMPADATPLRLTRDAFAESLRILMYYDSRRIPFLIQQAFDEQYDLFALAGYQNARAIRDAVAFGMLLCVTCSEDVARIDPDRIEPLTRDTFIGDVRVREQMRVCDFWPDSIIPDDHGAPLTTDVPILLISGIYDPVTPPTFAQDAAKHLRNALHVVAPGSHGVGGPCIDDVMQQFLNTPRIDAIDLSCIDDMDAGSFHIPPADRPVD